MKRGTIMRLSLETGESINMPTCKACSLQSVALKLTSIYREE